LGVISDGSSSLLINARAHDVDAKLTGQPLVLAGRVPVKVSLENGPISIGDFLAPSSTPGVAMRMSEPGVGVGIALDHFDGKKAKQGTVLCFVKVGVQDVGGALERLRATSMRLEAENARLLSENVAMRARLDRIERSVASLAEEAERGLPRRALSLAGNRTR
jgi:hypothetical protein